jgi:hypothetical protein
MIWTAAVIALSIVATVALLTVLSGRAHAADVDLVAHGLSLHGKSTRNDGGRYTERNPGGALRIEVSPTWSLQAGRYLNSWSDHDREHHSRYGLVDATPWRLAGARIGGFFFAVDGYPWRRWPCHDAHGNRTMCDDSDRVRFGIGAVSRWQWDRLSLALRGGPAKHSAGVIALELGVRL